MTDEESTGSDSVLRVHGTIRCSDLHRPQAVIAEIIEAPRLRGIATHDFVEFKNKREIYERRLAGNNPGPHAPLHLVSYRDSIPCHLINALVHMGMVEAIRIEDVTEEDLKNCVARNTTVDITNQSLATIEKELACLFMEEPSSSESLTGCVQGLCIQYFEILERSGCDKLVETAPDTAIDHILKRITPETLRTRMFRIIRIRQVDGIKKSFRWFFQELLAEARRFKL